MTAPLFAILCGMEAEAAALGRWRADQRIAVAISAGRPELAASHAGHLAGSGARLLLSWGIAGGLDPAAMPGMLLIADGVVEPGGGRPFAFDPALVAMCRDALPGNASDRSPDLKADRANGLAGARLIAGAEAVQFTPADKMAFRRRTGASAVDMESHHVASACRAAGIPCLAVRAISDPAGRRLPSFVADALDDAGRPRTGHVLRRLFGRPWELPALAMAGRDSRAALAALSGAADVLIPALITALDDQPPG